MTLKRLFSKRILSMGLLAILLSAQTAQSVQAFDYNFYAGNNIIWYSPDACPANPAAATSNLVGDDNKTKIWNFLINVGGLGAIQAAGVMGNMRQESGVNFNPEALNPKSGAYGIIQWLGGRLDNLRKAAATQGVPVSDLLFQLNYVVQESMGRKALEKWGGGNEWEGLKGQKTIEDATVYWHENNERAGESRDLVLSTRGKFAKEIYEELKGTTTAAPTSLSSNSVVFIDPGHGGAIPTYTDPQSGLVTIENHNMPESQDVLDVANQVKAALEQAGYSVILSHNNANDKVKFRDRATAASNAKAAIAISIHTAPGEINQVWPQRMNTYRQYGSHKDTFTNQATATKSEQYADIFATTRTSAEGHKVTTDPGNTQQTASFNRDGIDSKGNISLVQLWAQDVPWVYNEIAQDPNTKSISEVVKAAYAKGIIEGIKQAVPATSSNSQCTEGTTFAGGNLAQTTLAYAWPTYKGNTVIAKPEWVDAYKKARSEGKYIGGTNYPGIDCGGFVTNLVLDSGLDPSYNHGGKLLDGAGATTTQEEWLRANWERLPKGMNPADLHPGDVAIKSSLDGELGHTFIYVGEIPGFESKIASASLDERAPMAGKESPTDRDFNWYRKKG